MPGICQYLSDFPDSPYGDILQDTIYGCVATCEAIHLSYLRDNTGDEEFFRAELEWVRDTVHQVYTGKRALHDGPAQPVTTKRPNLRISIPTEDQVTYSKPVPPCPGPADWLAQLKKERPIQFQDDIPRTGPSDWLAQLKRERPAQFRDDIHRTGPSNWVVPADDVSSVGSGPEKAGKRFLAENSSAGSSNWRFAAKVIVAGALLGAAWFGAVRLKRAITS